jgi:excinuclease UvrABC nuclease subunit
MRDAPPELVQFEEWNLVDMTKEGWAWDHFYPGVYVIVDFDYNPLYVGCTGHVPARLGQHPVLRKIRKSNIRHRIYALPCKDGRRLEKAMIQALNPVYNIFYRTDLTRTKAKVKTQRACPEYMKLHEAWSLTN